MDFRHLEIDSRTFESSALAETSELNPPDVLMRYGPLLPELAVPDTPFQIWLEAERLRLNDIAYASLLRFAARCLEGNSLTELVPIAKALISIDSLREPGHQLLMRALHGLGRGTEAIRHYESFRRFLQDELDVRPNSQTLGVIAEIRGGQMCSKHGSQNGPLLDAVSRPGVVVLPLNSIDNEPMDVDLCNALTEDLIASLSGYRWFFVISALKSMTYRGRTVTPKSLSSELGVQYVIDGRVRRSGNQLQLRLNLSDAENDQHLWSDSVACYTDELLDAQDQLVRHIASLVEPELIRFEDQRVQRRGPFDLTSWQLAARARRLADLCRTDYLVEAQELASRAVEVQPDSPYGHAALAWATWMSFVLSSRVNVSLDKALKAGTRAVQLDPQYYLGHAALGATLNGLGDLEQATNRLRCAIDLNPSFPTAYNQLISGLTRAGRPNEALTYIEPLDLISPNDPFHGFYRCARALTYFFAGDDDAAIRNAELSLESHPGWFSSEVVLIVASHRRGDGAGAKQAAESFVQNHGRISVNTLNTRLKLRLDRDRIALENGLAAEGVLM